MHRPLTTILIFLSLILSAAIFGFFYAWVCSTMWGLDAADPRVAIAAMQAMNASVRNAVFFPAFFCTPFALGLTGLLVWRQGFGRSGALFAASGLIYFTLGLLLTMGINVPMNEALAQVPVPESVAQAQAIWDAYSPKWQFWNQFRTLTSGLSFALAVGAVLSLSARSLHR